MNKYIKRLLLNPVPWFAGGLIIAIDIHQDIGFLLGFFLGFMWAVVTRKFEY